uniref:3-hydroxyacyl-CoA dehydrogenase n=2 Tax=Chaetoceros debilis TaxID=122233 RepID=A0A7S3Q4R6_9STRA|mmetsp:Transcript_13122/g.19638  ORF Transcript_13122/g.19638 Transcript_13122/m.19638 type:complete len:322 (-) Transcript_13122:398-1363(-)
MLISSKCTKVLRNFHRFTYLSTQTRQKSFDSVAVAGLGLMGHGICQVAASSGLHSSVIAFEAQQQFLDKGKYRIEASVSKMVDKGKLEGEEADRILSSIIYTTDPSDLANSDFVVEAIIENMDLKKEFYSSIGNVCKPETIFASNTSSLSITEMAELSGRPDKFVGVHFFNPVQLMKLVEVIRTEHTDAAIFDQAFQWAEDIGKVAVKCGDTPGFIVNRLLVPSLMQAMLMVDRNEASIKDIDLSLKLGAGHPMGPLHLADYIGLDTCYYIVKGWTEKYPKEPAFVVPEILEEMVQRGDLGRKTGKGFYNWSGEKRGDPVA